MPSGVTPVVGHKLHRPSGLLNRQLAPNRQIGRSGSRVGNALRRADDEVGFRIEIDVKKIVAFQVRDEDIMQGITGEVLAGYRRHIEDQFAPGKLALNKTEFASPESNLTMVLIKKIAPRPFRAALGTVNFPPTVKGGRFGRPRRGSSFQGTAGGLPSLETIPHLQHFCVSRARKLFRRHSGFVAVSRRAIDAHRSLLVRREIGHPIEEVDLENTVVFRLRKMRGSIIVLEPHIQKNEPRGSA